MIPGKTARPASPRAPHISIPRCEPPAKRDRISSAVANRRHLLYPSPRGSILLPDCPGSATRYARRRAHLIALLFALLLLSPTRPARAYSVLTHEQLIDLAWTSTIVPILKARYPGLTPAQLAEAHAYAYGGCAIQDLGYYPFGKQFFSDLTHYVRSGDFVQNLFAEAHTPDELAFAIGALSHYIGDNIGHSEAINPAVATEFPKLRAKYGPSVNYAENKHAHVQTEFAFDINQISKHRLAPSTYLRHIGIEVPRRQLAAAFFETYGVPIESILGEHRPTVRTYRFGVRSFLPRFAYAENLLHHNRFPPDTPGPELDLYLRHLQQLSTEADWDSYRKKPGVITYLLAGVIVIVPKIGPAALLAIKGPERHTEVLYIESVNRSTASLHAILDAFATPETGDDPASAAPPATEAPANHNAGPGSSLAATNPGPPSEQPRFRREVPQNLIPNRDLDTGAQVKPGGYPLTDQTYARLLDVITRAPHQPVPLGLRDDVLHYYADPSSPIVTRRDPQKWARVQAELQVLASLPTTSSRSLPPQ